MRLTDFIARAVEFFTKTEARLAKIEEKAADPDNDGDQHCDNCEGSGKCDVCEGSGKMEGEACAECEGSGKCDACEGQGSAQAQIGQLKSLTQNLQGLLATAQKSIAEFTAQADVRAQELTKLKAELESEKTKANNVLASQGLSPAQLPALDATNPGSSAENPWAKYQRLLSVDPRAAGQFWLENADQILAAKAKAQA